MDIELKTGNKTGHGYLALPDTGRGPGVLLLHAWWGLTPFIRSVCDRLAGEGFVSLAPDLYGGQTATEIDEAQRLASGLDDAMTTQLVSAATEFLQDHEAVTGKKPAVIGFSLGAAYALQIERPVAAVVLFYGVADAQQAPSAAFQGHFGEADDFEPLDGVRELEQTLHGGGREVTFYTYPEMQHWFFESDRPEYDPDAADLAWQRTVAFFKEKLEIERQS